MGELQADPWRSRPVMVGLIEKGLILSPGFDPVQPFARLDCCRLKDWPARTLKRQAETARCCRGRRVTGSVHVPQVELRPTLLLYFTAPVTRHPRQRAASQRAKEFKTRTAAVLARALWWVAVWSEVKEEAWAQPRPGDMNGTQRPGAALPRKSSNGSLPEKPREPTWASVGRSAVAHALGKGLVLRVVGRVHRSSSAEQFGALHQEPIGCGASRPG